MKKLFSTRFSDTSASIALLVLRIGLGVMMIPHGYNKLVNFASKSATFADPFHIGSSTTLILVIFAEFFCASLLVLGLLTRFACIPLIATMSVALFHSHNGQIFGAGEKAGLYLAGFIALVLMGPGKISTDRLIGK